MLQNTFEGQVRKDKFQTLKKSIKAQQIVFIRASRDTLSTVKLSFRISEAIAKSFRPFSNGGFIKDCKRMFLDEMCPEKKNCLENARLLQNFLWMNWELKNLTLWLIIVLSIRKTFAQKTS